MCKLLEKAREAQGNISYYEVAKRLGVSDQLMNKWKNEKSLPNGVHTLKLTKMANLTADEALKVIEGGFVNMSLMIATALCALPFVYALHMLKDCILC